MRWLLAMRPSSHEFFSCRFVLFVVKKYQCAPNFTGALPDEIGGRMFFLLGKGNGGAGGDDAFDQPGHVASKRPHRLHPFQILADFLRRGTMNGIPVL